MSTNKATPFEKGEIIVYAGELLEVVENFGDSGIVKHPNDNSGEQFPYKWNAYGEECKRLNKRGE